MDIPSERRESTRPQTEVELSDLTAAALLVSEGHRLVNVISGNKPGQVLFVITGPRDEIQALLESHDRHEARVNAARFMGARRELLQRMAEHRRFREPGAGHPLGVARIRERLPHDAA